MVETGSAPALAQRCNMCWQDANGACFRTQCGHLFCESCAFQHFGQSQSCPSCGFSLEEADITDVTVGLSPAHFRRMMFQEIYKEPDFRSIGQSVVRTAMALHESVAFVLAQMTLEGQRAAESDVQLKADLAKQKHENGRLTMQLRNQNASVEQKLHEVDHKLRLREKELIDLQEAYKEKSRKCQAWEKAYGNLRAQTDRGRGGFTPPESPRVGAMRGPSGGGGPVQRPVDRIRTNSPHSSLRTGGYLGPGEDAGSNAGVGCGAGSSWPMQRPASSRGGAGGGGGGGGAVGRVGDRHVSPMLRPRQTQAFSHSITPSPTFTSVQGASGRFDSKRPETPAEVRGYYSRNPSPSNRAVGGVGGGAQRSGMATSGARGGFFPVSKSNGLF